MQFAGRPAPWPRKKRPTEKPDWEKVCLPAQPCSTRLTALLRRSRRAKRARRLGDSHVAFSDELHGRIAALPNVASIKVPGLSATAAPTRIVALRAVIPGYVTIGVSGDWLAIGGLLGGADAWYSVLGGLFPETAVAITRAAQAGNGTAAVAASDRLEPLWALFRRYGSLRVVSAAAETLGLVASPNLPLPLLGLDLAARAELNATLRELGLGG